MTESFPPEGMVTVGNYAFRPPFVPTELQLQQAEEFVFTTPAFEKLKEKQRRRNVTRLCIAAASNFSLEDDEGSSQTNDIPLFGGIVRMDVERHDGTPVIKYELLGEENAE